MREGFRRSGRTLPDHLAARRPTPCDLHGLAALMDDAYRGTIDSDGETLEEAIAEVTGYLRDDAMLELSLVAERTGGFDSALLMSQRDGVPVVAYVMTRATAKNRGLAAALLDAAAAAAWDAGHAELRAFIASGNVPSETIFTRAGFVAIATFDAS